MQKGNRAFEVLEFKNYSGTNDFYSNPEMNSLLGEADHIIVHTPIWESTGTNVALTVKAEDSADNENFAELNTVISSQPISPAPVTKRGSVDYPHGRFVRLKFTLSVTGGAAPTANFTCRVSFKDA